MIGYKNSTYGGKKHSGRLNPLKRLSLFICGKIWIASWTDILSLAAIIFALLASAYIRCRCRCNAHWKKKCNCSVINPYQLHRRDWWTLQASPGFSTWREIIVNKFFRIFSICLIYVSKYHYEYLAIFPMIKLLPDRTVILICNVVGKGGACVCLWMCLCAYACEIVWLIESMCWVRLPHTQGCKDHHDGA